ncbi:hypothetical protein C8A00DRAFT_15671 [Chaetomidium leptoderma]|uniref:Uncharacterized protein n=1 Tax=Chaetomidium leptoderma TaxID=669021 RepID=A0AAN6ZWU6_9PEZI|nr:hypothetical protein C8A00DRAFT_15671 [Chaetomidium leptoderma]
MVTTRRSARPPAPEDDSSSADSSIPRRPVRSRGPSTGTPATLRPSRLARELAITTPSPAKRKQSPSLVFDATHGKRRRRVSDAKDSIEVHGEDDIVDAAISATNRRSASRIEVRLPSIRRPHRNDDEATVAPSKPPTAATRRGLRSKRINRHINSHAAEQEEEEVVSGAESSEPQGSPELQSSALKRRPAKPSIDVYDIPEDDESDPPVARRLKTINDLELTSRRRTVKNTASKRQLRPGGTRLSSIREEQPSPRGRSVSPPRATRQAIARRPIQGAPLFVDDEVREPVEDGSGSDEARERDESDEQEELEEAEESEAEETESEAEETEAEAEAEANSAAIPKFVGITVRPYTGFERTITVSGDHLNNMSEAMGRSGWTGAGQRWRTGLLRFMFDFGDDPPARTKLGNDIFTTLSRLIDQLEEVPNALDLAGQSRFLAEKHHALNRAMSSVDEAVRKIEGQTNARVTKRRAKDLSTYIIPMLVLGLRTSFAIGVKEPDAVVSDVVPHEGAFTWTTVQYLMLITGWLSRLQTISQRIWDNAGSHADQQQDPDNPQQNHEKFCIVVRNWSKQLRDGVHSFNEQVDKSQEVYEKKQRDIAAREARRKEEEEDLADDRQHEHAFLSSLRQVTSGPRPMAEKFRKAIAHLSFGPPSSGVQTPAPSQQSQSRSSSSLGSLRHPALSQRPAVGMRAPQAVAPPAQPALPPLVVDYPPWPEDEIEWFLGELTRPDRHGRYLGVCADTLDRPLEEVRTEKERLKRSGRYRSPSWGS